MHADVTRHAPSWQAMLALYVMSTGDEWERVMFRMMDAQVMPDEST